MNIRNIEIVRYSIDTTKMIRLIKYHNDNEGFKAILMDHKKLNDPIFIAPLYEYFSIIKKHPSCIIKAKESIFVTNVTTSASKISVMHETYSPIPLNTIAIKRAFLVKQYLSPYGIDLNINDEKNNLKEYFEIGPNFEYYGYQFGTTKSEACKNIETIYNIINFNIFKRENKFKIIPFNHWVEYYIIHHPNMEYLIDNRIITVKNGEQFLKIKAHKPGESEPGLIQLYEPYVRYYPSSYPLPFNGDEL